MKNTELRIGNLVYDNLGGILKIKGISVDSDLFHINPIPLTEDWLIKFGFEVIKSGGKFGNRYEHELITLYFSEKGTICFCFDSWLLDLPYVHELQNLVFSINKKELTITQ